MEPSQSLPFLLGLAVLAPLAAFTFIVLFGPRLGRGGQFSAYLSIGAIFTSFVLSMISLVIWLSQHVSENVAQTENGPNVTASTDDLHESDGSSDEEDHAHGHEHEGHGDGDHHGEGHHEAHPVPAITGNWYTLGTFGTAESFFTGRLRLTIGYYIDALTVCMFCMVTLVATCIHLYSVGYMHEELEDVTDHEVTTSDGSPLVRPGRFPRFFQYMSLFSFSMLGLVISGNVAMTFVFWELVGICSYFLIGFYVERKSASNAANKAFIINRIGDFGMIIGLMAIWSCLGTLDFGDIDRNGDGIILANEAGIFSLVRPAEHPATVYMPDTEHVKHAHALIVPDGMVQAAARQEVDAVVRDHLAIGDNVDDALLSAELQVASQTQEWREAGFGRWILIIAGVGIFCGCVGKSAQFPLHTWLPDAMEGPTPVSALVHSATMVAAGVFLVGRFYPFFAPEVLLVIAVIGCITLFMAATIAVTATDIKRVLAYSTLSQLGYMMFSLGVGGWLAGMLHLFTHAFFKSLLFLGSGSVIHAVHSNEMTDMGGLLKKMPWTAYTMLVGCLAIAGAGIPFVIGLSGYYSKDAILEQARSFALVNGFWGSVMFYIALGGAAITTFYMFRLWYMTFLGQPRDQHRYDHAHESPPVMYVPLVILAVFAVGVAWTQFLWIDIPFDLKEMLEQARPAGTLATAQGELVAMTWPNEHAAHTPEIVQPVTWMAFGSALAGFLLATLFYGVRYLNPDDARRQFYTIYRFLLNKWWFDELYDFLFVRPVFLLSRMAAGIDTRWIDGIIDGLARLIAWISAWGDRWVDQGLIDGLANSTASLTYRFGLWIRNVQTGRIRQYVMFIVVGMVAIFVLISFFLSTLFAG